MASLPSCSGDSRSIKGSFEAVKGGLTWWSARGTSITAAPVKQACHRRGPVGAGRGGHPAAGRCSVHRLQTLDKGLRAFFISGEGQQRITLAAVQQCPGFPAALLDAVAGSGVRWQVGSRRIRLGGLAYGFRLDKIPQQRHDRLELVIQLG